MYYLARRHQWQSLETLLVQICYRATNQWTVLVKDYIASEKLIILCHILLRETVLNRHTLNWNFSKVIKWYHGGWNCGCGVQRKSCTSSCLRWWPVFVLNPPRYSLLKKASKFSAVIALVYSQSAWRANYNKIGWTRVVVAMTKFLFFRSYWYLKQLISPRNVPRSA